MRKKCSVLLLISFLFLFSLSSNSVLALSATDFVPPAQGGTKEVEGEVEEEEDGVVNAQSAQDGFNHANQDLKKIQQNFKTVVFPSGIGYIARGSHDYHTHENYNATQLEKRLAYVSAYTKAKVELAQGLEGLSGSGRNMLAEKMEALDTSIEAGANISEQAGENIDQAVDAFLKGFVVYDIEDNTEEQTVKVSIATSSKTLGAISNVSAGLMEFSSINEGLDYVLNEIENGIVPPVGGRVITVPDTEETAIISFGAAVIRKNKDADTEGSAMQFAQRVAEMRSRDAMISIIEGDQTAWQGGLIQSQELESEQFEVIRNNNDEVVDRKKLEETKKSFQNVMKQTDTYQSFREGRLPPGVNTQLYEDGTWVYAVSVYLPSLSEKTEDFYEEMQQAGESNKEESNNKSDISDEYKSGEGENEPGPSGEVTPSEDL